MGTENAENPEIPSADLLMELDWQSIKVSTFRAALDLQVWNKVASEPKTAQRIAEENDWDLTGTQRLLDALCAMKLLCKEENAYQLLPVSKTYLISDMPGYMGDMLLAGMRWEGNGKLADAVRTGIRPIDSDYTSGNLAAYWADSEAPSHLRPEKSIEGKDDIWRLLDIQATDGLQVLDVACGPASTTLAYAKQNTGVTLTLNDWPPVVERTLMVAEKLGIKEQVRSFPGDIHITDFGKSQYDLIWIGDFLHFWSPEVIVSILKKLNQALVPGGVLVVKETVVDEGRREDFWLLGALWLFGSSIEGNLYTPSEWLDFIVQAGFSDPVPISREGEDLPLWFKATKQ